MAKPADGSDSNSEAVSLLDVGGSMMESGSFGPVVTKLTS